jgi:hypothetical protein
LLSDNNLFTISHIINIITNIMYGNNFSYAQVMAITAKEKEKYKYQNHEKPIKEDEVLIHLKLSTIKKLKALGRGWKSKLSAKVEEWVNHEIL